VQPIDEVDGSLADYIVRTVLAPEVIECFVSDVLAEIDRDDDNGPAQDLGAPRRATPPRAKRSARSNALAPEPLGQVWVFGQRVRSHTRRRGMACPEAFRPTA
jgi:hypothetical protein